VNDADVHSGLAKSTYAVVPLVPITGLVSVSPPVVYPLPEATSPLVVYAVVAAPHYADEVYSAILIVSESRSCSF